LGRQRPGGPVFFLEIVFSFYFPLEKVFPMLASRYKSVQVNTASPERVMVMLFEAALRHIRNGRTGLQTKQPGAPALLQKAAEIVAELQGTLKPQEAAQALCDELRELYGFVIGRLALAVVHQNARYALEAEKAFTPIAEAFIQVGTAATQSETISR
jgi:flagellar secretion chaperone FliS